jgi:hypothetical protein
MKNLIIVFLIAIVLISCEDITQSDPNKISNVVKYTKVLENQQSSVIQPLAAGKTWYYLHKYYNFDGGSNLITRDSMFVEGEYLDNNEKWFKVWHPIFMDFVYMTNTDKGLWYKCHLCDNASYLEAAYPDLTTPYNSSSFDIFGFWFDSLQIAHNFSDTLYKSYEISQENVILTNGNINAIKYKVTTKRLTNNYSNLFLDSYNAYYVPDVGLVKLEKFYYNKLSETYELRNNFNIKQNYFTIDMGILKVGDSKSADFSILTNLTGSNIKVLNITYDNITNIGLLPNSFNYLIENNKDFILPISIYPTKAGTQKAYINIMTDVGNFYVTVICTVN